MLGTVAAPVLHDCDLAALLERPELQQACSSFLAQQTCSLAAAIPTLCVLQGEYVAMDATALPPGLCVGSQDATTCLIAVLWCPATRRIWAAHLDQHLGHLDVQAITDALEHMQQPCVYMCGAYSDDRDRGPATASSFLQLLHGLGRQLQLALCCVGPANTADDGAPRCRQLVLDTASGTVHPWLFQDRGPQLPRRFAAQHCRCDRRCTLSSIWCAERQQLQLGPFDASLLDSWQILGYERMLLWPDSRLLVVMSTSPAHEPPWFCEDMRSMMQFLIAAQEPDSSERQVSNTTTRFFWDGQQWRLAHGGLPPGSNDATADGVDAAVDALVVCPDRS